MKETRDELKALGEELQPTAEDVARLDGSLEAQQDTPSAYPLLRELGVPSAEEVLHLQRSVVEALDKDPPAARELRRRVLIVGSVVALVALAAGALALLT